MIGTFLGFCVFAVLYIIDRYVTPMSFEGFQGFFQIFFIVSLFLSLAPLWKRALLRLKPLVRRITLDVALHDRWLLLGRMVLVLCSFSGIVLTSQRTLDPFWTFMVTFILLGIVVDLVRFVLIRFQKAFSIEHQAAWLRSSLERSGRKADERAVMNTLERFFSLFVEMMKEKDLYSVTMLSRHLTQGMESLLRVLSQVALFRVSQQESMLDSYMAAEAVMTKRLSWVTKEAVLSHVPLIVEEVVRLHSRLFLAFHLYHESLGYVLLISLSQTMQQREGSLETDGEVTTAFSELVKTLIERSLEQATSDRGTIEKVLELLETHLKSSFRRHKSTNPAFLMQPLADIGQMLAEDRYQNTPDRAAILEHLKRLLAQFSALESITSRMTSSHEGGDTSASYHEDLPFTKPLEGES